MIPSCDFGVAIWANRFFQRHQRKPTVSELPYGMQLRIGKKVFEYADYRDTHHRFLTDENLYEGCLSDHGVKRNVMDVYEVERLANQFGIHPETMMDLIMKEKA